MAYLTEHELVERFQFYTLQLEKLLDSGEDFLTVTELLPFGAHINKRTDVSILNYNPVVSDWLGYSKEEINQMGIGYFEQHLHPYSWQFEVPKVLEFYAENNPDDVFAFVQFLHLYRKREYKPVVTFTKICKSDPSVVLCIDLRPHQFGPMSKKMERIMEMDQFRLKNFKRFNRLTPREKEILILLARGLNNPRIADRLYISRQTVETHRKNINRKLGIQRYRDVMDYAIAFDLVIT